ncbi:RNA polymerase sigma factor [Bariatricus sp. SGI.154]|uniref:RNA polymerase sigma factor n=1 Tax=Bariatricus sp. SGI.154 TaxID=3420549 RepID=UPI003D03F55B
MGIESKENSIFDTIYNSNFEIVYKVALKYSRNHHAAEEIAQNVFIKLYLNIDHINVDAARSWLILTAKYMALNLKRDRAREYLVEDLSMEEETILADSGESPEEVFVRKIKQREFVELKEDIFAALYEKNPRWYDAITISYVLEKPQKEVAENMGVTLEVLHSMLYRARKWIKENYKDEYDHLHKD